MWEQGAKERERTIRLVMKCSSATARAIKTGETQGLVMGLSLERREAWEKLSDDVITTTRILKLTRRNLLHHLPVYLSVYEWNQTLQL